MIKIHAERLLTQKGWLADQTVTVEGGVITGVAQGGKADRDCPVLVPGLFDLHNHGGQGLHFRGGTAEGLAPFLDKMLEEGVTDMLLTVSTNPVENIRHGLAMTRDVMRLQKQGALHGTRVAGVHMEGPYLSTQRPGAMNPEQMLAPSVESFQLYFSEYLDVIKEVSIALELPGALALAAYLTSHGVCVQAGHTDAGFEVAQVGFAGGFTSLCHTFNACRPINHRDPAVVTAALLNRDVYCEVICDLVHLHPAIIEMIYRMKGVSRMIIVSDSTALHGMPDGEYDGRVIQGGVVRTKGGALSGGRAYLGEAVRNVISIGIAPEDAFNMASQTPAQRMGMKALGAIEPGRAAHLAAYDSAYAPLFTVVDETVYR